DGTTAAPQADTSATADDVPASTNIDAENAAKLPQVEVITSQDEPKAKSKPKAKKQARKSSPSKKSANSVAQAASPDAEAGQGAGGTSSEGSRLDGAGGPGAAGIVRDYVATDSTVGTKTDTP